MSYRLNPSEPLPHGVARMALEQIDKAAAALQTPGEELDEAVHECRKHLKKLRGLLRLVRKEIGEEVYQRENKWFRDAGRLLSDLRDSRVMIDTVDLLHEAELEDDAAAAAFRDALPEARDTLGIFYRGTRHRVVKEERGLLRVQEMIREARTRVESWPVGRDDFTAVAGGLRKIYKRGRNRQADARDNPAAERFHEWRKRVKYLWYSVRILRPIWPELMKTLADEIHHLSDYLGDEHDLAELQQLLETRPTVMVDDLARGKAVSIITGMRKELQVAAFRQGRRIYAENPDAFVSRLAACWETRGAWR